MFYIVKVVTNALKMNNVKVVLIPEPTKKLRNISTNILSCDESTITTKLDVCPFPIFSLYSAQH